MSFRTRPLSAALGAEITGIDLSCPLDPAVMAELKAAWHRYSLLLFRDQTISADDQKRFAAYFGEFQTPHAGPQMGNETLIIGNVTVDGVPGELPNGEMQFHQDRCYSERPTLGSVLYAIEIPSAGGNTMWASMYRAFETLPRETQRRIEGLHVRFNFDYTDYEAPAREGWQDAPHYVHPLVIAHPETGRPALFCNRLMADSIVELPRDEGRRLIEELCVHLERPENFYEHVWRAGDVMFWDNLATAHARTDFDPAERRHLRRATVKGPKPDAYRESGTLGASRPLTSKR